MHHRGTYRLVAIHTDSGERKLLREGLADADAVQLIWQAGNASPDWEFTIELESCETPGSEAPQQPRRNGSSGSPPHLTGGQRREILVLGLHSASGRFDRKVLGNLFDRGLVEVGNEDQRLALTDLGKVACRQLCAEQ